MSGPVAPSVVVFVEKEIGVHILHELPFHMMYDMPLRNACAGCEKMQEVVSISKIPEKDVK